MNGTAPYDERNEADFDAMTKSLEKALKILETDLSVPATEKSLAELACCSRGTLRNRDFPLRRLKEIKKQREKKLKKLKFPRLSLDHRIAVETHLEDKQKLRLEIELSFRENAILVNKSFSLEARLKSEVRLKEHFQQGKEMLEAQNKELTKALLDAGIPLPEFDERKLYLVKKAK